MDEVGAKTFPKRPRPTVMGAQTVKIVLAEKFRKEGGSAHFHTSFFFTKIGNKKIGFHKTPQGQRGHRLMIFFFHKMEYF